MKKSILLFSILLLYSCSITQSKVDINNKRIKNFITDCYNDLEKHHIFINDKVLKKTWNNKSLESLIRPEKFVSIQKFSITTKKDVIQFHTLFTEKEFSSMKRQIKNRKIKKWSQLVGTKYILTHQKQKAKKHFSFSIPVFNKNKDFAIIYTETSNSGDIRVYKKNNLGIWKYFASGSVWRAD